MTARDNLLSLHHLTVSDVPAPELVDIAAATGCRYVGVFVRGAQRDNDPFPVISGDAARRALIARLDATGVRVHNLEVFIIRPSTRPGDFDAALEMGAAIGAARLTAQIADANDARAFDNFAALCERAASFDLAVHIEFNAFSIVNSLQATQKFLSGRKPANASIALDALHLYRNDGGLDGLSGLAPSLIGYAQICDGPLRIAPEMQMAEAIDERAIPGEGEFDLTRFVASLPPDVVIDVEAPSRRLRDNGVSALERARRAVDAARGIIAAAGNRGANSS
ncbi:sugar phosphate isomerase/epimerase family protein [Terrarubrum flagellatum]|uniref:sugar phosphate isomerase/epimerase family protein n=1 Tax=Terrirubrum flagellatum TaxID=2895980 RepID=UPI003145556E